MRHPVHLMLVNDAPGNPENSTNWPIYAALLTHAIKSHAVNCHDSKVRAIIVDLVRYLLATGDYHGALRLAEKARDSWTRSPNISRDEKKSIEQLITAASDSMDTYAVTWAAHRSTVAHNKQPGVASAGGAVEQPFNVVVNINYNPAHNNAIGSQYASGRSTIIGSQNANEASNISVSCDDTGEKAAKAPWSKKRKFNISVGIATILAATVGILQWLDLTPWT